LTIQARGKTAHGRGKERSLLKKSLRILAASLIVLAGATLMLVILTLKIDSKYATDRDFISYWAAGQQLVRGQSPYDFQAVKALEVAAGRDPADPMFMMRNPPDALFLALPLGFTEPKTGLILWLFVLLGVLLAVSFMIWRLNGSPDSRIHLLGFAFAPALTCLMSGQLGIVLLLGVVLFLYLCRDRPYLAGASLLFCAVKPHLFGPFGAVLLVSCAVSKKSRRVIVGFGVAMAASCALAYVLDPHAWSQYSQMMHAGGALSEPIPALSPTLRLLIAPHAIWLQFVPEVAACAWAVWYFWSRRSSWDWMDHGLVVLLVGVMCAPYGWFTDESLVLPAVLTGLYRGLASRRPVWPIALIAGAALAELMMNMPIRTRFYLWTTPMWLCWYLYATGRFVRRPAKVAA
jgi:hypothetical protein